MPELAEVFATEPEQCGAVELRVPADIVVGVRVQVGARSSSPRFLRVVAALLVDGECAPVLDLTPNVVAALEEKYPEPGRGELVGERAAACAAADDDDVVVRVVCHASLG